MPHPFPHHYQVEAHATPVSSVALGAAGLPAIESLPPPEFDGPEGYWSPETLLLAAVADCYLLSVKAVASASRLHWDSLRVQVAGVLDRVEGTTRFTHVTIAPELALAAGSTESQALAVLKKARSVCLISNSLRAECTLEPRVRLAGAGA